MPKRLLIGIVLALIPLSATAGELPPATSSGLGPETATGSGGSNADAGSLQPAGTSPLQSSTSSSTDLTAPSNLLQGSTPGAATLRVLAGETDGAHSTTNNEAPTWPWLLLALAFGITATIIVLRDRRRFHTPTP